MTWARRGAPESEAIRLFDAYRRIGKELGVKVAPAGLIQGHPVDTNGITAVPDMTLTVPFVELGPATAAELQRVAWDTVSPQVAPRAAIR